VEMYVEMEGNLQPQNSTLETKVVSSLLK